MATHDETTKIPTTSAASAASGHAKVPRSRRWATSTHPRAEEKGYAQHESGLDMRRRYRGLVGVSSKVPIRDRSILSLVYTPGVGAACTAIEKDPMRSYDLTCRGNTVAILTDGTDLFGDESDAALAELPIAEGKSVIFKTFAGVDAFPLPLDTTDDQKIVEAGVALAPSFGAICLDDISSPRAFTIAENLERAANIPVFSNQHHGSAILALGALYNALKVVGKELDTVKVIVNGAGIAGIGIARLLTRAGVQNLIVCDRVGAIYNYRPEHMNWAKASVAKETNPDELKGTLEEIIVGADVFIGASTSDIVTAEMIRSMADDPVILAMAVPDPEIQPEIAQEAGAAVIATGRSDYPNTLDTSLVFPGVFRGLLDSGATNIRLRMLLAAARALADAVDPDELGPEMIVPHIFDFSVAPRIAEAVVRAAIEAGEAERDIKPEEVAENTLRYVYEGRLNKLRPSVRLSEEANTLAERAVDLRERHHGVIEIRNKVPIRDHHILNMIYVPPTSLEPAEVIHEDPHQVYELTGKGNLVGVVTDGSAVLGLGDIGPRAAMPVMEGKAALFNALAGVEAFPICISERDPDAIVDLVATISPALGGINLEDISAPRCFEIEEKLKARLDLPVMHDDQHGTAIVVLSAMLNAVRLTGRQMSELKIVVNGAGAAGIAVSRLLLKTGVGDLILCDRAGAISRTRKEHMNQSKIDFAAISNKENKNGTLADVMVGADVFIGVSAPKTVTPEMVTSMAEHPIIFALANPVPEIFPDEALRAGAYAVATGRSDFPNQVNNSLAFPGVFRGALDVKATEITDEMKIAAATAIADLVPAAKLSPEFLIPDSLDLRVSPRVAAAVAQSAIATGHARATMTPDDIEARTRDAVYEGLMIG